MLWQSCDRIWARVAEATGVFLTTTSTTCRSSASVAWPALRMNRPRATDFSASFGRVETRTVCPGSVSWSMAVQGTEISRSTGT